MEKKEDIEILLDLFKDGGRASLYIDIFEGIIPSRHDFQERDREALFREIKSLVSSTTDDVKVNQSILLLREYGDHRAAHIIDMLMDRNGKYGCKDVLSNYRASSKDDAVRVIQKRTVAELQLQLCQSQVLALKSIQKQYVKLLLSKISQRDKLKTINRMQNLFDLVDKRNNRVKFVDVYMDCLNKGKVRSFLKTVVVDRETLQGNIFDCSRLQLDYSTERFVRDLIEINTEHVDALLKLFESLEEYYYPRIIHARSFLKSLKKLVVDLRKLKDCKFSRDDLDTGDLIVKCFDDSEIFNYQQNFFLFWSKFYELPLIDYCKR